MNHGSPNTGLRCGGAVQAETALSERDHSTSQVGRQRGEKHAKILIFLLFPPAAFCYLPGSEPT